MVHRLAVLRMVPVGEGKTRLKAGDTGRRKDLVDFGSVQTHLVCQARLRTARHYQLASPNRQTPPEPAHRRSTVIDVRKPTQAPCVTGETDEVTPG